MSTPDCYPHPRELEKRAEIARESAGKIDESDHPGARWRLCRPCGVWHPAPVPGAESVDGAGYAG